MSKVWGIIAENFDELVEKINKFNDKNKVLATQVFPDLSIENYRWYALVYYESSQEQYPTPAQEKKVNPATDKQKNLLKTLGYKEDISKLTKQEAFKLIDERILPKEKRK